MGTLSAETSHNILDEFSKRTFYCQEVGGGHIEHLF